MASPGTHMTTTASFFPLLSRIVVRFGSPTYPDGTRSSATAKDGRTTYYFYDGANVLTEADQNGGTLTRYTSVGVDNWISMTRGNTSYYYHTDALGSVTAVSDRAQQIAAAYEYDAFGSLRGQSGGLENPVRFTGRTWNDEIGLYDYRLRSYDASVGRFSTEDSWRGALSNPATLHRYTYALNSPLALVDPYGLGVQGPQPFPLPPIDAQPITIMPIKQPVVIVSPPTPPSDESNDRRTPWPNLQSPPGTGLTPGPSTPDPTPTPTSTPTSSPTSSPTFSPTPSSTPTPIPWEGGGPSGGGSGGGDGGGESKPLPDVPPSYFRTLSQGSQGTQVRSAIKMAPVDGGPLFRLKAPAAKGPRASDRSADLIAVKDMISLKGPDGTEPVLLTPSLPSEIGSNAVEVAAVDFMVPGTSVNKGTVFVTKTVDTTYDHDYGVCNRFHGFTLETAAPVPVAALAPQGTGTPWVWYTSMRKGTFVDEAFTFVAFVDEKKRTFTVDSHWLTEQYPAPGALGYDYAFNPQIWSPSAQTAYDLMLQAVGKLSALDGWKVGFADTVAPATPSVLVKSAQLAGGAINLTVQSWLSESRVVTFTGYFRQPTDRNANLPFSYDAKLNPGFNTVNIPLTNPLDALIDVEVNNFKDRVYAGAASFFGFDDHTVGGTSTYQLDLPACSEPSNLKADDFVLAGCATLTGTVGLNGWAGLAITLNVNDLPTDVSTYSALTFFAKGDGKTYRLTLETDAVRQLGSTDFHQLVFTTSSEWKQVVIPFAAVKQLGWDPAKLVPFTGHGVVSVAWASVGGPLDSINLSVDRVAFVNPVLIVGTKVLPNTADAVGPYTVTTQVLGSQAGAVASLFYSVDGGTNFASLTMATSGTGFAASIPGQALGTEVSYYVEVSTPDGNMATDPVDVPYSVFRFQVSQHPYLLVDDFRDTNPVNLLGGSSGAFGADSGSTSVVYYDKTGVHLVYDVSKPGSVAGYFTLLNQADLRSYNAVSFAIKGAAGKEKVDVGLRDTGLRETRIPIGEYLPGGVSTSWQKVTIPLVAFASVANWSSMDNFNIVVGNWLGSGAGQVYLTSVRFETLPSVPIVVDNFDNMIGENGVGGHLWTWKGGGATVDVDYDPDVYVGEGGAGYRVAYADITETDWALAVFDLSGLNASVYNTLSLSIKGRSGGERPHLFLVSRDGDTERRGFVRISDYVDVTTSWQEVKIPLAVFEQQGVALTRLSYFQVAFEWEKMSGTIYLDDVRIYSSLVPAGAQHR